MICMSKIGTYPLQAIIEQINSPSERNMVLSMIQPNLIPLIQDPHGCHVIEKIITCFSEDVIPFIYSTVIENFLNIASHCNGLCVVKKVIIHSTNPGTIDTIKDIIVQNAAYLIQNAYGNYVIQVALTVKLLINSLVLAR